MAYGARVVSAAVAGPQHASACHDCGTRRRTLDLNGRCRPCVRARFAAIPRPQIIALRPDAHRTRRPWTEDEEGILRRDYDGTWQTVERLANALNRTANAVKGKATLLGLRRQAHPPVWTKREIAVLTAWGEKQSAQWIQANKLPKRTLTAIQIKLKRLGIELRLRDGWFTKRDVCELLGRDHRWVQARIDRGEIPASHHHGHAPQKNGSGSWHIDAVDLRRWVIEHCGELTGRNVDLGGLVALLIEAARWRPRTRPSAAG